MPTQFFSISLIILLSAMLPGPDFAIVTKNTLLHSRRTGIFTTLGIAGAILIHVSYCVLGIALIIAQSTILFNLIKFVGAAYLIYLGIQSFRSKEATLIDQPTNNAPKHKHVSDFTAFKQGFLCNLLNPKATLFFLALFTVVIKPDTSFFVTLIYALEIPIIAILWFCSLTIMLSHPRVLAYLNIVEKYIPQLLGIFLIFFGIALAFITP